jgi:hypothetical protein
MRKEQPKFQGFQFDVEDNEVLIRIRHLFCKQKDLLQKLENHHTNWNKRYQVNEKVESADEWNQIRQLEQQ